MDIKDKLTEQEKAGFENLRVEAMVLQQLLNEKRQQSAILLKAVLEKLGYNPMTYGLEFNAGQDRWDVKLRPDALVIPSRQDRRHPIGG